MKLIRNPFKQKIQSVITIGNFDGLHLGHQRLIKALIESAHEFTLPSVLLTFEPHPTEFFSPQSPASRLMRFSEKWNVIKQYGVDYFCCLKFNAQLACLSAENFVKTILVDQFGAKKIIIGDNFRFGAKRLGDVALLQSLGKKYHFDVMALPQALYQEDRISSTRVRNALKIGDFETVQALTQNPFTLSGKVAYGDQIGRQLGYPTANIHLHRKQVPLQGIFVVRVHGLDGRILPGVASIGYRPTFHGKQIVLEVFLFDFNENIYGRSITVEFLSKIRDEIYFDSVPKLIAQIDSDVAIAKRYHATLLR
ncbi:MAG: bifunctional riboflavin kinase/FAD synthetase [Gammaproteobacteria bacterium CG_4_10_14_0_8_um_filter_38_16]|nr:MAG: bifunctional riboflavin kinase/FAD synthetase [Gammaproteobacteria bacterium CG_4_10_14_0_8_um_filter_38_16]PJA04330.1 MAG: bifunctional riboflavin kinase/FAD synthetase [Gammaproteobacteria bacterium CG_4_10_14_0_2_um_filter_38_22]PJB10084.1 MAG: bifunctional riboflavin kinase/FAD synthetase [Gammaproteobacteria bacterium CG_4_9_14_3_um_filter_38_9]